MEIIPTGLFRQMTHEIRAQRIAEARPATDVMPVASAQGLRPVSDREANPELLELITRRDDYLRAFELFSALFEALSAAEGGTGSARTKLQQFSGSATQLFRELSGLLLTTLAGTHLSTTAPTRLEQSMLAESSLGSVGFQLSPRLLLAYSEAPSLPDEMLEKALHEACHGGYSLAAVLVELAGEAWGNALVPDDETSGHAWAAHARQQWAETDLQGRLRQFGILLRRLHAQSSRFEGLIPPQR